MNIIIVGCGKVGCTLVEALSIENHNIVVIDSRPEKVSALTDTVDVMGIVGNGVSHTTLKQAGIETADLLIAVTGSDEEISSAASLPRRVATVRPSPASATLYIMKKKIFSRRNSD